EGRAQEATATAAQELSGRIDETGRGLAGRVEETQKRLGEAAEEITQKVEDLWHRSREGAAQFKDRLKGLEATASGLGQQLQAEQAERRAEQQALRAEAEQRERELREEAKEL